MTSSGGFAPRTAPPGWYASPGESGFARFWDGQRWTEGRQPLPPLPGAVPVLPMAGPTAGYGDTGYPGVTGPAGRAVTGADGRRGHFRIRLAQDVMGVVDSPAARNASRLGIRRVGLGLLAFAMIWLIVSIAFIKPAVWDAAQVGTGEASATGTVVAHRTHVNHDGDRMCAPEASFTVDGLEYVASSATSSSHCPGLGSAVEVIYRVADPGDSRVTPDRATQLIFLIFPLSGLIVLLVALRLLFRGFGGSARVARLRASRRPEEPGISSPTSQPVIWDP